MSDLALTDAFLLPSDVMLVPVARLPEAVSGAFDHDSTDVALTRPRSRTPSSVVDEETAALLEHFRTPTLIVEAVMRRSLETHADPDELLEDVYPALESLIACRVLVPARSSDAEEITRSQQPGDTLLGHTVLRAVQVLDDTEVYLGRAPDGRAVALKLLRPGAHGRVRAMFRNEARVLSLLDGDVNPRLLDSGETGDRACLVLEWRPGVDAAAAAAELRRGGRDADRESLLQLSRSVLEAYAHLHGQGVVHSDIHPRNVLVDGDGSVSLVDFGLAHLVDDDADELGMYRAGVAFFLEPEYAHARLEGWRPPTTSPLGEQYSLAALIYELITGSQYLDFSLERDRMLRQIAGDVPVSFVERGLPSWPGIEEALRRALSKSPDDRFPSVAAFAGALAHAGPEPKRSRATAPAPDEGARVAAEQLDGFLARTADDTARDVAAPTASVTYGAAGVACALYRIALAHDDAQLLSAADLWSERAAREARDGRDAAFSNDDLDIAPRTVGRVSPYHTVSGVHAVRALVAHALGDNLSHDDAIRSFAAASHEPCDGLDLVLGRTGTLLAVALLLDTAPASRALRDLGDATLRGIWQEVDRLPPVAEGLDVSYLGMAHGWAGILYATLRYCEVAGNAMPRHLERRLAELAALAQPVGRGVRWPVLTPAAGRERRADSMPGWCNGSAGQIHLWTAAHDLLGEPGFLTLATRAAWHAWEERRTVGHLCCGLAGQAYALLNLHRHSAESIWLERAQHLARRAPFAPGLEEAPDSLYKGEAGIAALIADLDDPRWARMPFFEDEGWRSGTRLDGAREEFVAVETDDAMTGAGCGSQSS